MMNRNLLSKIAGISLCLLVSSTLWAQTGFTYSAPLQKVVQSGFYAITVSPEIAAKANAGLSDIRILDSAGRQVPFFFRHQLVIAKQPEWIEFPLESAGFGADKRYYYIIRNSSNLELDHLSLNFRNTDATRLVSISGSDDGKQWFAIRENISLQVATDKSETSFMQDVEIPVSNYGYFRITLEDKGLTPVKLLKAGNFESRKVAGAWIALPAPVITQKDSSDKRSYYQVQFGESFSIDKLVIHFVGAPFFKRQLAVFTSNSFNSPLIETTTASSLPVSISIAQKTKQVWVVMDNKDNPPLQLNSAKAFMLRKDIITYLKEGQSYRLNFGDSTLTSLPSYDLGSFQDSIPGKLPTVLPGPIRVINQQANVVVKDNKRGPWITWISIGLVLAVLLVITMRMTGEVNKTKNTGT